MGLSSLAVVTGIIQEIYQINIRTDQLYQQKFYYMRLSKDIGQARAKVAGSNANVGLVREIIFNGERPFYSNEQKDPNLGPGDVKMTKEHAERTFDSYLSELHLLESQIDQELEQLKAKRTALQSEKDEFTKYIAENIKNTFKNNYMG